MGRKAGKATTGWRKRYLVNVIHGSVWLLRGSGKKINGTIHYMVHIHGKWQWIDVGKAMVVDGVAQLVALRLQGVPVRSEPRW